MPSGGKHIYLCYAFSVHQHSCSECLREMKTKTGQKLIPKEEENKQPHQTKHSETHKHTRTHTHTDTRKTSIYHPLQLH